jgi:hypothetical protein
MSELLQLINDNYCDLAIALLRSMGKEISNTKNSNGVSALMLATTVTPKENAVSLITALMEAGASLNKRDNKRRHVLLYACEAGVDPIIIDEILKWNSTRCKVLEEWWHQCNDDKDGVFILACKSGNYSLAEHILNAASKNIPVEELLHGRSNNVLKALKVAVKEHNEDFVTRVLRMCRQFTLEIPNEHEVEYGDCYHDDRSTIYLTDILKSALDRGMFAFLLECRTFSPDELEETVWKWFKSNVNGETAIPIDIKHLALRYEKKVTWEENRSLALLLLRVYNGRRCNDILEHISSFIYCPELDLKILNGREEFRRNAKFCFDCENWYLDYCEECIASGYSS